MDWEMYDLDGEDVVIRPLLRAASRSKSRKVAQSTKPMPRSAGSVNRPTRCEYVMGLIQFCHDHDAVLQCANQFARCPPTSDGLSPQSCRSSLRHKTPSRSNRRKSKRHKSKERPPVTPTKKVTNGKSTTPRQSPGQEDPDPSPPSIFTSHGLQRLPLSAGGSTAEGDNGKDVDCECHYPGVSVLPGAEKSSVEVKGDQSKQPETDSQDKENIAVSSSQTAEPIHFANPWKEEQNCEDRVSLRSEKSPASTVRSELDSPTTVATPPLEPPAPPSPAVDGKKSESKHIDTRFLPQRSSSKKINKNAPSDTLNLCSRIEEDTGQVPNQSLSKSPAAGSVMANNRPLNRPKLPRLASAPFVHTGPSGAQIGGESQSDRPVEEARPQALRSKSFDTLSSSMGCSKTGTLIRSATSDADLSSGWTEKDGQHSPANIPGSSQQKPMSRSARIFALRMLDRGLTHNVSSPSLHGQMLDEDKAHDGSDSNRARDPGSRSTTPAQREYPRKLSAQLPQSPRTQGPSSPPNVPLPADPPVPPSRCSSRKHMLGSIMGTAAYPAQMSSDALIMEPNASRRPSLANVSDNAGVVPSPSPLQWSKTERQRCPTPSAASPGVLVPENSARAMTESRDSSAEENKDNTYVGVETETRKPLRRRGHQNIEPLSASTTESSPPGSRCTSPVNSRKPSRVLTYPEPQKQTQTSQDLEFRVAFLEQQNKRLRDALVSALDDNNNKKVPAPRRYDHDADADTRDTPRAGGSGGDSSGYPGTPATPTTPCATPVVAEHSQANTLDSIF